MEHFDVPAYKRGLAHIKSVLGTQGIA